MLPFSAEALFAQFGQYNQAIWPAPVSAFLLGALALWLLIEPRPNSGRIISGILAILWVWNGAVYHLAWFSSLNFLAPAFGVAFLLQGLLFAWSGAWQGRHDFRFVNTPPGWAGLAMVIVALAAYPVLNALAGNTWPNIPAFGVTPCPLTLFTLGVLLMRPRMTWGIAVIPLMWALAGAGMAWVLGVREDLLLALAAAVFVIAGIFASRRAGT
ncbi:MAG: DUF6064 family protein [Hyphomicrobiales bacterium]